jgi:hypothetical protein
MQTELQCFKNLSQMNGVNFNYVKCENRTPRLIGDLYLDWKKIKLIAIKK